MTFDPSTLVNATQGMDSMSTLSYITQHTLLPSLLILIGVPFFLILIIATWTGSIAKPNFWKIFFVPLMLIIIIAILIIVYPILPYYLSIK